MTIVRRVLFAAVGCVAAGALAAVGGCTERHDATVGVKTARTPLYYVDPMHPSYKSDKPGIAPDCGMALEPVYADSKGGASATEAAAPMRMSAAQKQMIGLRVEVVGTREQRPAIRLYGRVAPDEARVYRVNVGIEGVVKELSPLTTGSQVTKGQWLTTFSAPDARATIQSYMVSLDAADRAKQAGDDPSQASYLNSGIRQSVDRLYNIGMSQAQIDEISRTRIEPADIRLASPANGFIIARRISAGERFDRGAELYRIADLRRVWVVAEVFGVSPEYIRPGITAQIAIPGRSLRFPATVSRAVLPEFDAATQSLRVRLEADNPDFVLRPDMYVDVLLEIGVPAAMSVPSDALLDSGTMKRVFVETAEGVFEPRTVETGWRFGDRVQILKGLNDGDRVVVSGTFLLDSESRLRHAGSR